MPQGMECVWSPGCIHVAALQPHTHARTHRLTPSTSTTGAYFIRTSNTQARPRRDFRRPRLLACCGPSRSSSRPSRPAPWPTAPTAATIRECMCVCVPCGARHPPFRAPCRRSARLRVGCVEKFIAPAVPRPLPVPRRRYYGSWCTCDSFEYCTSWYSLGTNVGRCTQSCKWRCACVCLAGSVRQLPPLPPAPRPQTSLYHCDMWCVERARRWKHGCVPCTLPPPPNFLVWVVPQPLFVGVATPVSPSPPSLPPSSCSLLAHSRSGRGWRRRLLHRVWHHRAGRVLVVLLPPSPHAHDGHHTSRVHAATVLTGAPRACSGGVWACVYVCVFL